MPPKTVQIMPVVLLEEVMSLGSQKEVIGTCQGGKTTDYSESMPLVVPTSTPVHYSSPHDKIVTDVVSGDTESENAGIAESLHPFFLRTRDWPYNNQNSTQICVI